MLPLCQGEDRLVFWTGYVLKTLKFLAQACAVIAGLLLTLVTLVTCVSLIGRNLYTWTSYRGFDPEVGVSGNSGQAGSGVLNAFDNFTFPNIPDGIYNIKAELQGFKKFEQSGISLSSGASGKFDVGDSDAAPIECFEPIDHAQQCRLSRSRRAFEQDVAARDKRGHQQLPFALATNYIVTD